jgi:TonB family protein
MCKLWYPSCILRLRGTAYVLLDKIQSGYLLLETPQGFARIDLSPRQRLYLLWTFRNFHHLSVRLLNPRQRELVNSLFRHDAGFIADVEDETLVIGVVENFVSPKLGTGTSPTFNLIPKKTPPIKVIVQPVAVVPRSEPVSQPISASSGLAATDFAPATRTPMPPQLTNAQRNRRKLARMRLVSAFAALCLCVGSVAAWYRIQGLPVSQAHSQQINAIAMPSVNSNSNEAATRVESPVAQNSAVASTAVTSENVAVPATALEPASITAAVPASIPASTPKSIATSISASIPASIASPTATAAPVRKSEATPISEAPGQNTGVQASRAPLYSVYPDYPEAQARGAVSLKAGLDSAGKVRTVKLISGNRALGAAAIRAVRQWRYRPYLKNGEPVATETYIRISFISQDVVSMSFPPSIPAAQ